MYIWQFSSQGVAAGQRVVKILDGPHDLTAPIKNYCSQIKMRCCHKLCKGRQSVKRFD